MIGGILLAAGRGSRSGADNKLLVRDPAGVTMVARSAMALEASRLDRVCIVLGHQADLVRAAVADCCPEASMLVAADHADGLAASLVRGVEAAVRERWQAAVICLADMPGVDPDLIDRLIAGYREAPGVDAVVPVAGGRRGNPVLWDAGSFPALSRLRGDRGGRDLLDRSPLSILTIDAGDDAVLVDHDTPDALIRFGRDAGAVAAGHDAPS